MMAALLSQDAEDLDLEWVAGDPVSLSFDVADADWSGTYKAQIRDDADPDATLFGELTVTATFAAPNTAFHLTMAVVDSTPILARTYAWDMQQLDGVTRLTGRVFVRPQVTTWP